MPVSPDILKQLTAVPQSHGVYLWKDAEGKVLYVGKAKQLRSRMRQYTSLADERAMIPLLMEQVAGFDYLVTGSEHESLILEKNLISQYNPPFNVDFKDDKSYPFIAITRGDVFPAIKYTREKPQAQTRYFGPYTDARAAREMVDTARRVVPICRADCAEWKRLKRCLDNGSRPFAVEEGAAAALGSAAATAPTTAAAATSATAPAITRPCFDYHVGLGPGPCAGALTAGQYAGLVRKVER
ncbi:MAG: GIY-YIG nuclease family protein, partial [Coriobacteriales bacterium]|nr:GIY-YIG nuclease family protein [Coriobacteriales bacterium]